MTSRRPSGRSSSGSCSSVERFDYSARPQHKLEVPIQERIAAMHAQRAQARANKAAKQVQAPKPQRAQPAHPQSEASPGVVGGSSPNAAALKKRHRRRRRGPENPPQD